MISLGCFGFFEDIAVLPEPVKRYFRFAIPEHCKTINSVSTKFTGLFCIKRQGQWLSINGEDYYTVNSPGFAWLAEVKINPLFWLTVKDSYIQAKGKAQVKAYSLVTVATATGPGIDQGALSRWLGSAVLFPEALLPSRKISWEHVDENSARLIFSHEGIEIIAVVYFGRRGEIVRIVTDRYCSETRNFEKWTAYYKSYTDYNGRKIPTEVGILPQEISIMPEFALRRFVDEIGVNYDEPSTTLNRSSMSRCSVLIGMKNHSQGKYQSVSNVIITVNRKMLL